MALETAPRPDDEFLPGSAEFREVRLRGDWDCCREFSHIDDAGLEQFGFGVSLI
jgi:hypothetical protein